MSSATAVVARPSQQRPDIQVQDYGSLALLRAVSSSGRHWLAEHERQHAYPSFPAGTLVCEPCMVQSVIDAARAAGLVVETR